MNGETQVVELDDDEQYRLQEEDAQYQVPLDTDTERKIDESMGIMRDDAFYEREGVGHAK